LLGSCPGCGARIVSRKWQAVSECEPLSLRPAVGSGARAPGDRTSAQGPRFPADRGRSKLVSWPDTSETCSLCGRLTIAADLPIQRRWDARNAVALDERCSARRHGRAVQASHTEPSGRTRATGGRRSAALLSGATGSLQPCETVVDPAGWVLCSRWSVGRCLGPAGDLTPAPGTLNVHGVVHRSRSRRARWQQVVRPGAGVHRGRCQRPRSA